jgi:hypothetical protein
MQFRTTGILLFGRASHLRGRTNHPCSAGNYLNGRCRSQTADLHSRSISKAVSITLQPDEKSDVSPANGILYQMSGSTEVALDGEARRLNAELITGGKTTALTAGSGGPSTFLHFFLVP